MKYGLSWKLVGLFLAGCIGSIAILAVMSVTVGEQILFEREQAALDAVRSSRQHYLEKYFEIMRGQMFNFSQNRMVAEATAELGAAFARAPVQLADSADTRREAQSLLGKYYQGTVLPRLAAAGYPDRNPDYYIPQSTAGRELQAMYIAANPHPPGERLQLDRAAPACDYNSLHQRYHPRLRDYLETFGFYDIFLFDLQGNLVYSALKEVDFATNFVTGPYADTNLAEIFARARQAEQPGTVFIEDYRLYAPSLGSSASFIAAPVFQDGVKVGVAAFQLPIDEINKLVQDTSGLGESGQVYLVGRDLLMRSATRFDPEAIFSQEVQTPAARQAIAGQSGTLAQISYTGREVLASYAPVRIEELQWGIIAEIDKVEIAASAQPLRNRVMGLGLVIALIVTGITWLVLDRLVLQPLTRLNRGARRIETGDYSTRVEVKNSDEIGELAGTFNHMAAAIESDINTREKAEEILREREERFSGLVENIPGVVYRCALDEHWTMEYMSDRIRDISGYPASDFINNSVRSFASLIHPDDTKMVEDAVDKGLRENSFYTIEYRILRADGDVRWVHEKGQAIHDGKDLDGVIFDITDRKLAEVKLQKLSRAVEDNPSSVVITDVNGNIEYVNPKFTRVTGYTSEEAIGKNPRVLNSGKQTKEFYHEMWKTISSGREWHGEFCNRKKNGELYWEMASISPVHDGEGKITHFVAVKEDITEQRAARQRFRVLFEQSSDAHLIFDENGIVECNNAAVEMLGCKDRQDLLSHHPVEFSPEFQPDGSSSIEKSMEMDAIARTQGFHRFDWIHRKLDGEEFPVEVTLTLITLEERPAILGVWHDLTERKRVEEALREAREAADAANLAKSTFLANMSHELRTPMNAILGYSEMLTEEAEDLEQAGFIPDLKKINQAGKHLLALINDILDLSKIEAGKIELFAEDVDIGGLVDEVGGTAEPLMSKNNNQFRLERDKELGVARQDLTKLRQSLFNLLSNAAKFTREGSITLQANRTKSDGADWLTFTISDTGIGIAADKLDHVFEEFTQADGSTTRDYGGTGIGLAISRRFCRMMGGDITVQSQPGEGSAFTIRIPAIAPSAAVPVAPKQAAPVKTEAELRTMLQVAPGHTVLVIDDDREAREIIERFLKKDGFEVMTAASGEEGLRIAHRIKPATITLDVMMPDMDGWSVLRALQADPELRDIPVVIVSMVDDKTKGYSLGATDYLTKPVSREQLLKVMNRYHCADDFCVVLVVEDDEETRNIMARTMEKEDWDVMQAGNGREALEQMTQIKPDLILLDLMMPVMDGFDFLTAMRARPEWQHIPVIVITAKDLTADDRKRLTGRVEEIVEKSTFTREQLLRRVSETVASCNISETETNATGKNDE